MRSVSKVYIYWSLTITGKVEAFLGNSSPLLLLWIRVSSMSKTTSAFSLEAKMDVANAYFRVWRLLVRTPLTTCCAGGVTGVSPLVKTGFGVVLVVRFLSIPALCCWTGDDTGESASFSRDDKRNLIPGHCCCRGRGSCCGSPNPSILNGSCGGGGRCGDEGRGFREFEGQEPASKMFDVEYI